MNGPPPFRSPRHHREILLANWQDAEELAAWHIRHVLGFSDARVTPHGPDGGVDVVAEELVAQVKHYDGRATAPEVQQLRGAGFTHLHALFYALNGFTSQARHAAEDSRVALFTYSVYGDVEPANSEAVRLLRDGHADPGGRTPTSVKRRAFEDKLFELAEMVRLDPRVGSLPPRVDEEQLAFEAYRLLEDEMERAIGEIQYALQAYDYYAAGPSGSLQWYAAAGGPEGLVEMLDEAIDISLKTEEMWLDRAFDTRAELLEFTRDIQEGPKAIMSRWQEFRDSLPADKRGFLDKDQV